MDFLGFSFRGKHSINDFKVYRVSGGSRYSDDLIPQLKETTATVNGADGTLYFSSSHEQKTFSISIAFDSLTESAYRELRQWLNGKDIGDLIFDEAPYKVYSAKVTGTPQLQTICFTENNQRAYKGEGTIQFTCYYPYAHTPTFGNKNAATPHPSSSLMKCGIVGKTISNNMGAAVSVIYEDDGTEIEVKIENGDSLTLEKANYLVSVMPAAQVSGTIEIDGQAYCYTDNSCFEAITENRDGRFINHYALVDYPNKREWWESANLLLGNDSMEVRGDVPSFFTFSKSGQVTENATFRFGGCAITIKENCSNLLWDSRTGIVTGEVNGARRKIKYSGKSYGALTPGATIPETDGELNFNYWYY